MKSSLYRLKYWHLWVGCKSWFFSIICFFLMSCLLMATILNLFFSLSFWRNPVTCCVERLWNYWSSLPSSHRFLCVDLVILCFICCDGLLWWFFFFFFPQYNVVIIIRSTVLTLGLSFISGVCGFLLCFPIYLPSQASSEYFKEGFTLKCCL